MIRNNNESHSYIIEISVLVIVLLVGIILTLIGFLANISSAWKTILITIGLAFISATILSIVSTFFSQKGKNEMLEYISKRDEALACMVDWGIEKIHLQRSEINSTTIGAEGMMTKCMEKLEYNYDIMAFGLRQLRSNRTAEIKKALKEKQNLKLRFLIPHPQLSWLKEKDDEELSKKDTAQEIKELLKWIKELQDGVTEKDRVQCRLYNLLPQDFYCRVDDYVFVGPQFVGYESSSTITYVFRYNSKAGDLYSKYFESLWNHKATVVSSNYTKKRGKNGDNK